MVAFNQLSKQHTRNTTKLYRWKSVLNMDNEYTTAAKNMIDQAVEDRNNGIITLAEFYKICAAAVTIFQTKVGA